MRASMDRARSKRGANKAKGVRQKLVAATQKREAMNKAKG